MESTGDATKRNTQQKLVQSTLQNAESLIIDIPQYILLLFDTNPCYWCLPQYGSGEALVHVVNQLFMFINALLLLNRTNCIALFSMHPEQNELLFRNVFFNFIIYLYYI